MSVAWQEFLPGFWTVIHKILEKKQEKATCMKCGLTWSCLFMVGLVLFTYREQYKRLLPDPKMKYLETYNAFGRFLRFTG